MEILVGIVLIGIFVAFFRVLKKTSIVKKVFKQFSLSIINGDTDNRIIDMAKANHYAIGGFVAEFMYYAEEIIEEEIEDQGLEINNFRYDTEFEIKDAKEAIEKALIKRFKVLNVRVDESGICSI